MVPTDGGIELQFVLVLIIVVESYHLIGIQSIAATKSSSRSSTLEATVARIVGVSKDHESVIAIEISSHSPSAISVLVADA